MHQNCRHHFHQPIIPIPWGLPRSNFEEISGIGKLGPVLLCGFVGMILHLGILRQYRRVTDGQTHDDG